MSAVVRLLTVVDLHGDQTEHSMSVSARHEAELADGRRLLLLDDRGWSSSGPPDIWTTTSPEDVAETARTVVGPDEPFGSHSSVDMAADHWADMLRILERNGVVANATELAMLPHNVVLSARLAARLSGVAQEPGVQG